MTTAIAKVTAETFDKIETRFIDLVDEQTFKKEVSFALQHFIKNPKLKECIPSTILQAVLNIAQVGLTLNPIAQEAYLIPRWSRNGTQCVLEPSYQGLVKLVTDTGSVKSVSCYAVHDGDDFEVSLGTSVDVMHKPKFATKKITHVYAVAELPSGQKMVEVMTIEDCYDIREKSESYKAYKKNNQIACPWIDWEQEMCRKCCIKRLVKYLPKTEQWEKLREAISLDNDDYELDPLGNQASYLQRLIDNAAMDDDGKAEIERRITDGMSVADANTLISQLKDLQLDPIVDSGGQGGEKKIADSVQKRVDREP